MVYTEPDIKNFINYSEKLFNKTKPTGLIYFISYNAVQNKLLPKSIIQYYKSMVNNHIDGKIIYLNRKNKTNECLVLYGKDKYKNISYAFGSAISYKIE